MVEVLAEINCCTMSQVGMIFEILIGIRSDTLIGYNINSHVSKSKILDNSGKCFQKPKEEKLQISGRLFHVGFEKVAVEGTFRNGGLGGFGGAILSLSFFFGRGGGLKMASLD